MWTNLNEVRGAMFVRFGAMALLLNAGMGEIHAQATKADPVDVQGWMSLGINKKLNKSWKLDLDFQSRYFNNVQTHSGNYLSFGVQRKINKHYDATAEYRLAMVQQGNYNRYSLGIQCDYKWRHFTFEGRALVQNQIQDFDDVSKPDQSEGYWRVRAQAKYKINKRLDVYASVEPIMKFGADFVVDNWRDELGVKWEIEKGLKLNPYFIYRPDYGKASYNRLFYIYGLQLDYSIR